jgi:hypothetical protein
LDIHGNIQETGAVAKRINRNVGDAVRDGYPEWFAQEALGHNSKAVHRACAKRALMKIPSLEGYEQVAGLLEQLALESKFQPLA